MKLLAAVILLGLVAARASAQPAPQPSDVLAAVQAHYTEAATFRAKLRYELTPAGKPRHTLRIDGTIEAVRPSTVNARGFKRRGPVPGGPLPTALGFVLGNATLTTESSSCRRTPTGSSRCSSSISTATATTTASTSRPRRSDRHGNSSGNCP